MEVSIVRQMLPPRTRTLFAWMVELQARMHATETVKKVVTRQYTRQE
jgi:hypothetical protein